jgi:hypothetical protein
MPWPFNKRFTFVLIDQLMIILGKALGPQYFQIMLNNLGDLWAA